jgi:glycosidase
VTFLDLHDTPRFRNDPGATTAGLELAYTFLLTTRGTPLLYYGDEIGLPGAGDPDNRRDFPGGWREDGRDAFSAAGRTPEEQSIFSHVQRLIALRAAHPGLRGATTETLLAGEQTFVYRRGEIVVALNNDTQATTGRLPIGPLGPDLLGRCGQPTTDDGAVIVAIPARTGCLFPATGTAGRGSP